jgi:hypothetical protein
MEITNLPSFQSIIQKKVKKYKIKMKRCWKVHHIRIHDTHNFLTGPLQTSHFYNYCMWELKYQVSVKKKMNLLTEKMYHKLQLYISIINKCCKKMFYDDVSLHITEYLLH